MPYVKYINGEPVYIDDAPKKVSYTTPSGEAKNADLNTSQGRSQYSLYLSKQRADEAITDEQYRQQYNALYPQQTSTTADTLNSKGQRIDQIGSQSATYGRADKPKGNQNLLFKGTDTALGTNLEFADNPALLAHVKEIQAQTKETGLTYAGEVPNRMDYSDEAAKRIAELTAERNKLRKEKEQSAIASDFLALTEKEKTNAPTLEDSVLSELKIEQERQRQDIDNWLGISRKDTEQKIQEAKQKELASMAQLGRQYFSMGGSIQDLPEMIRKASVQESANFLQARLNNEAAAVELYSKLNAQQAQQLEQKVAEYEATKTQRSTQAQKFIDSLVSSGTFAEMSDDAIKSIAEDGGLSYGVLLEMKAAQKKLAEMGTISAIEEKIALGTATPEEAKKYEEYKKAKQDAEDAKNKLTEPSETQKKLLEYAKAYEQYKDNPEMLGILNQFYGVNELDKNLPASVREFEYWKSISDPTEKEKFAQKVGLNDATISYLNARTSATATAGTGNAETELPRLQNTRNVANDLNNPTNLTKGGVGDQYAIGYTPVTDANGTTRNFLVFANPEQGFLAGQADIAAKINGGSSRVSPNSTIQDLLNVWVGGALGANAGYQATVQSIVGVPLSTKLSEMRGKENLLAQAISKGEGFTGGNTLYESYGGGGQVSLPPQFQNAIDTADSVQALQTQLKNSGYKENEIRIATDAFNENLVKNSYENSSYQEKSMVDAIVSQLPLRTRDSAKESDALKASMIKDLRNGNDLLDIVDKYSNFYIEKKEDKPLARELKSILISDPDAEDSLGGISWQINNGDYELAINATENKALQYKAGIKPEDQGVAENMFYQLEEARKIIEKDPSLVGFYDGGAFNITKSVLGNAEKQDLADLLTEIYAVKRNQIAGTAVTNSEGAYLKDFIPNIADPNANILAKIKRAQTEALRMRNTARKKAGLKEISFDQFVNPNLIYDLYDIPKQMSDTELLQSIITNPTNNLPFDVNSLANSVYSQ